MWLVVDDEALKEDTCQICGEVANAYMFLMKQSKFTCSE